MNEALAESKDYDQAHAVCAQAAGHATDHILTFTEETSGDDLSSSSVPSAANQILPIADAKPPGASPAAAVAEVVNPLAAASHNRPRLDDEQSNLADGDGHVRPRACCTVWCAHWCVGNSAASIALLVLMLVTTSIYFALQCTSLMDELVEETGARRFVAVTMTVEVLMWILCVPVMLNILVVFVQVTCRGHRTVRDAILDDKKLVEATDSKIRSLYNFYDYFTGVHSPYFFGIAFMGECSEFFFQCLAVEQLTRAGVAPGGLVLYTSVILLNALVRGTAEREEGGG